MENNSKSQQLTRRNTTTDNKQKLMLIASNPALDAKNQERQRDRTVVVNDKN